jgi:hypothetical protein
MRHLLIALALAAGFAPAHAGGHRNPRRQTAGVHTAADAKAIAERDTGGQAVSARRIPLNGASGGWEVDLRTDDPRGGWRCVVDCDTRMVHTKTRIPQPAGKASRKHH